MRRWLLITLCAMVGAFSFFVGWLVPVHLKAVDASVIEQSGRDTPGIIGQGIELAKEGKLGAAELFLQTAKSLRMNGAQELTAAASALAGQHPSFLIFGGAEPRLESLFTTSLTNTASEPFGDFIVRHENRERVLSFLKQSSRPLVQELLQSRTLTNTVLFPPSSSSSGQAYDAALCVCALLVENAHLSKEFSTSVFQAASDANHGKSPEPLEMILMDLLSLSQRLNWNQLAELVAPVQELNSLRVLSEQARNIGPKFPMLFSAVVLTGKPEAITQYLTQYSRTGIKDLEIAVRAGSGGITELLRHNQPLVQSSLAEKAANNKTMSGYFRFLLDCCWQLPLMTLLAKWVFYIVSGFMVAEIYFQLFPAQTEGASSNGGLRFTRNSLFSLGFLLFTLLLTEPFLAQADQRAKTNFHLSLPLQGNVAAGGIPNSLMNKPPSNLDQDLMILALFFVLQALIYTACLMKLAEIRRQAITPQLKLKLLENEDHLFDAGLYLGFVGTIICLILATMGIVKPSLMAAYSSTSFGIVFVSIFKIFHLRQVRRTLLLEINATASEAQTLK